MKFSPLIPRKSVNTASSASNINDDVNNNNNNNNINSIMLDNQETSRTSSSSLFLASNTSSNIDGNEMVNHIEDNDSITDSIVLEDSEEVPATSCSFPRAAKRRFKIHNAISRIDDTNSDEPMIKKSHIDQLETNLVKEFNLNPLLTKLPLLPLKHIFYFGKSYHLKFLSYIENKNYKCNELLHQIGVVDIAQIKLKHGKLIDQVLALEWNDVENLFSSNKLKGRNNVNLENLFYLNDFSIDTIQTDYKQDVDYNFADLVDHSQFFLYETKYHYIKFGEICPSDYYYNYDLIDLINTRLDHNIGRKYIKNSDDMIYYIFIMTVSSKNSKVNTSNLIELNFDSKNELHKSIKNLIHHKTIILNIKSIEQSKITFELYLNDNIELTNVNQCVSMTTRSNYTLDLHYLMTYFFFSKQIEKSNLNVSLAHYDESNLKNFKLSKSDNENLFDLIYELQNSHKLNKITDEDYDYIKQNCHLRPLLRPYQIKAIKWMLRREHFYKFNQFEDENDENDLHELYSKVTNKLGKTIYYHKYCHLYSSEKPLKVKSEKGGILADEMGLGKTLEVLALISINQCKLENLKKFDIESILNNKQLCDSIKKPKDKVFSCTCQTVPDGFINYSEKYVFNRKKTSRPSSKKNKNEYDNQESKIEKIDDSVVYQCRLCNVSSHANCVNYKYKQSSFLCMLCTTKIPLIESKATLVVTPAIISHQWVDEIKRHVDKKLKVLVYSGTSNGFIQPRDLSEYDIVITTYDVLADELSHIFAIENKKDLRNVSRYATIPSPINCLKWWRIVLDEAQMVHSTNSKCAEMANRLSAVNKWCVTGTPIGRSLSDLYGLFVFIREDPYLERKWFNDLLYLPYVNMNDRTPMANAVSKVLWRSSKRNVANQIDIPIQTEKVYWLEFSPFEKHLYERVLEGFRKNRNTLFTQNNNENNHNNRHRELQQSSDLFLTIDPNLRIDELDRSKLAHLLSPILDLRLTCNHPQLILRKRSFMLQARYQDQNRLLTMEKSIEMLEKKTQGECDNIYRSLTMHRNAVAGIHVILEEYDKAINMYQKVLDSESREYNDNVKIDLLQKIHATFNLIQVMKIHDSKSDTQKLESDLKDYEKKYSIGFDEIKLKNELKLKQKTEKIDKFINKNYREWLICILNQIESMSKKDKLDEFWNKFNSEFGSSLLASDHQSFKLCGKEVKTFNEIKLIIVDQFDRLFNSRDDLIDKLKIFFGNFSNDVVQKAAYCHLRRDMILNTANLSKINKSSKEFKNLFNAEKCHLCVSDQSFSHYIKYLFSPKNNIMALKHDTNEDSDDCVDYNTIDRDNRYNYQDEFEDRNVQSLQNRGDLEKFLKLLYHFYRTSSNFAEENLIDIGKEFLDMITGLKEEFNLMRKFWTQTSYVINALDELEMCKMRMRLQQTAEKNLYEINYLITEDQIDAEFYQHNNASIEIEQELKRKLGQLYYLKNLKKSFNLEEGKENEEPCSICLQNMGFSWYVLVCGHSFCSSCFKDLVKNEPLAVHNKLKCPLCRVVNSKSDAFLVSTKKPEKETEIEFKNIESISDHKPDDDNIFKNNSSDELHKIKIRGNCNSAKVEGVVKCLINIIRQDTYAKCLVFSEHVTILELINDLMKDNYLIYKYVKDNNSFQKSVQQFKTDPNINVLLMPYSFGANGLNLIEATHVLLVEPTLNKSQEIQAIGRIHRIGQTKPTFVHRFLIRDSIEELVFRLFKSNSSYSSQSAQAKIDFEKPNCSKRFENQKTNEEIDEKKLTIADIRDLFFKL